jgi:hypothetical protein
MALSDLQVFTEYSRSTMSEILAYNVELFNAATRGGIVLRASNHDGDYSDTSIWAKIQGLVRRRNAYGSGAVTEKVLTQLLETSVKVAAGIAPIRVDPGMLRWILSSPEEAGAVVGGQMAKDTLGDMLSAALLCARVALVNEASNYYDATAVGPGTATLAILNTGRSKLGDRADNVACWVLHSKQLFDIYGAALSNSNLLFNFGNVKVTSDGFGNPLVMTDSASLLASTKYHAIGVVPAGLMVDQNADFEDNIQTINGDENIKRTYQAEWSYNVGVMGFQWDKTNGGHSPNDTALGTGTNWDKYASNAKDLCGIVVKTN